MVWMVVQRGMASPVMYCGKEILGGFRFIPKHEIELISWNLLQDYAAKESRNLAPPIDLDDRFLHYLDLRLDLDDLNRVFELEQDAGSHKILGALCLENKTVWIDQSLDPYDFPDRAGRYNFTVGLTFPNLRLTRM